MKNFDITFLKSFTPTDQMTFLIDCLTRPEFSPWGRLDSASFENVYRYLKGNFSATPGLGRLLERYLIAHLLKDGADAPQWAIPFARRHIPLDDHFPSISWDTLTAGQWTTFPAALVKGDRKQLQWFIAGLLSGAPGRELLPPWALRIMDDASRQALLDAAAAASAAYPMSKDAFLCVFPLALPSDNVRIQGASLGLPAAMAFMKLLSGEKTSARYLATGTLRETGAVGGVECLADKLGLAADEQCFSLFVYPEENSLVPGATVLDVFPVSSLAEAWCAVRRHAPGNGGELLLFARMMKDPEAFVAGMERVDASWIKYEADRGRCTAVIRKIAAEPALFAGYVERIDRHLQDWALDEAALFLDLVPPEDLTLASRHSPLSAFRLHTQRIALANHRGDTAQAEAWAEQADALFPVVLKGNLNLCADFINNRFVTRHNRYQFDPVFPEDLFRILKILQRRHAAECEGGCPTDPVLARLCGTVAQNFAFCGPDFLGETTTYARRAMAAFGSGDVPEFRRDMLRQQSYLAYAFLDAGDYPRAENSLMAFIGAGGWREIMEKCRAGRLTVWHHAALARFFADTGETETSPEYLGWCTDAAPFCSGGDHPRQLWAFNMGRIAVRHEPAAALAWFQQSLALCLDRKTRPTIRIMALLPLSGLRRLGDPEKSCKAGLLSEVTQTALKLNETHFRPRMESNSELLLENIWNRPQALFPFTYR
ncbi:hypothetical protein [Desulfococcus sp.]|uniref:hypothetical protein n=1 Tax=Desulfococcus sp. TaxID=2025834 RepID=UPI0035930B45